MRAHRKPGPTLRRDRLETSRSLLPARARQIGPGPASRGGLALLGLLLACVSCTVTPQAPPSAERDPQAGPELGALAGPHRTLEPGEVSLEREPRTVEQSWLLDLYTFFHAKNYTQSRLVFPGAQRGQAVAHLLLPDGDGTHATVLVFPILAGSHVVSEALAKALISHGFAVARMERPELDLEDPSVGAREFSQAIRDAVHDARRLVDFLTRHPRVDAGRLASAGVSLGGIQALLLAATDPRIRGGFFIMVGGGLPEILWESEEPPVRIFRERVRQAQGLESRADFIAAAADHTRGVDPLSHAGRLLPERVLIASGRFDKVIPPAQSEALWQALGQPRWIRLPSGHYQLMPFFWWTVARGADHLDRVFETDAVTRVTVDPARVSDTRN